MARLNNSPDPYTALNDPDPYIGLNDEPEDATPKPRVKGPVLASAEEKPARKPAKDSGFDPTVMKSVVAAINKLTKKIDDTAAPAKPPQINVEAPKVNVEAPVVNIPARPEHWRIKVVSRDDNGRIEELDLKVIK